MLGIYTEPFGDAAPRGLSAGRGTRREEHHSFRRLRHWGAWHQASPRVTATEGAAYLQTPLRPAGRGIAGATSRRDPRTALDSLSADSLVRRSVPVLLLLSGSP